MSESKVRRKRGCRHCMKNLRMTASALRAHAKTCKIATALAPKIAEGE